MNKRQAKKHIKKVEKLALISWEMAELYLKRLQKKEIYRLWNKKYD